MIPIPALIDGYRSFRADTYPKYRALYHDLVTSGQAPRVMIVACCDSRVDPATIFSARPGELFVVRNVANLIPPYDLHGEYHGTSAALEFAITGLEVEHVIVLGHTFCGGVKAFLDGLDGPALESRPGFVARWMSLLRPTMAHLQRAEELRDPSARQCALEQASVVNSLANLETFPFVEERVAQGRLSLHGAHFDIEAGVLWVHESAPTSISKPGSCGFTNRRSARLSPWMNRHQAIELQDQGQVVHDASKLRGQVLHCRINTSYGVRSCIAA